MIPYTCIQNYYINIFALLLFHILLQNFLLSQKNANVLNIISDFICTQIKCMFACIFKAFNQYKIQHLFFQSIIQNTHNFHIFIVYYLQLLGRQEKVSIYATFILFYSWVCKIRRDFKDLSFFHAINCNYNSSSPN